MTLAFNFSPENRHTG